MGLSQFACGAGLLASLIAAETARAQVVLPEINVTASRIVRSGPPSSSGGSSTATPDAGNGGSSSSANSASIGIVGASTSVITSEQIRHSPAQNLPDILGQEAGVQLQSLYGAPNGSGGTVDVRGFGAFAQSNTLVLVNGRRYQDFDLQGFDFSSIPLNGIERIEITRGNSGTVLYGDGAIGGVINIVTKDGATAAPGTRVEGFTGSYGYNEGRVSTAASKGPWAVAVFGSSSNWNGYRTNSATWQDNGTGRITYTAPKWSAYLNISGDLQRQDFPGALRNVPTGSIGYTLDTPRASNTPYDWGKKRDLNISAGFTAELAPNVSLIVDGGVRKKHLEGLFYSYTDPNTFLFNLAAATPNNYLLTEMTTASFTPRVDATGYLFGLNNHLLTGVDLYDTTYGSDRRISPGALVLHRYDIRQTTAAFYGMDTVTLLPDTQVSLGGRVQRNLIKGTDVYDPNADVFANTCCYSPGLPIQAPPFSGGEWQYAAHVGVDQRITSALSVFGRAARAFRLPNADERVGAGNASTAVAPTFDLKTQTSYDIEGGVRVNTGHFSFQSSVFLMNLNNEIHFIPAIGTNINLDPTRRIGWENMATFQASDTVRLKAGAAYIRATFREGPFAGNDIPLVSRWTGNAGFSWDIWSKLLSLDVTSRMWSSRVMDNDQANTQPKIPGQATIDMKLYGAYDRFFWSAAVLNVLDKHYYDYAIASGGFPATTIFAATPGAPGVFNAYPLPGRTFLLQAGATF